VKSFLAASRTRARDTRAARPALARQARAWEVAGALAWGLPALGGVEPFRRRVASGLGWWAFTSLMLDWHLGMVESADGAPRTLRASDACTLTRAWLVPLAADDPTPLVCALGLASDALDGPLARRGGGATRAGRDLEGAVDAAFAAAVLRGAVRTRRLGAPAAALEGVRLGAGISFTFVSYFAAARAPAPGLTAAARATTPLRAAGLLAAASGRRRAGGALVSLGALAGMAAAAGARRGVARKLSG
jgi:phosphatidylglycerophosphate synthase